MIPILSKKKFLETLSELPWISHACKKTGIARATVYRWMDTDKNFKSDVEKSLGEGRESICEAAEILVMKKVQAGNFEAAKFVLKRYDTKKTVQKEKDEKPVIVINFDKVFKERYDYSAKKKDEE